MWGQLPAYYFRQSDLALILLDCSLKSVLVVLLAVMICAGAKRRSAALRHWVWLLAMCAMLGFPWFHLGVPAWPGPRITVSSDLAPGNRVSLALGFASNGKSGPAPTPQPQETRTPPDGETRVAVNEVWLRAAPIVWFAGTALCLAYIGIGRLQLWRIGSKARPVRSTALAAQLEDCCHQLNLRRRVRLLELPDSIPMTWGWFKPVVLLPTRADQWPSERQRVVLWHELAHVKRWDCLTQMIAKIACAVYWFNPLVWLAARNMHNEQECACDDLVLNGGCEKSAYASHLLEIVRELRSAPRAAAVAMGRPSRLETRLLAILDSQRSRGRLAGKVAVLSAVMAVGIGLFLGGCTTTTNPPSLPSSFQRSDVGARLQRFVEEKEAQAIAGAEAEGKQMLPEYTALFAAAAQNDWLTTSNIWEDLRHRAPQYEGPGPKDDRLHGTAWQTVLEVWGAFGNIRLGGDQLVAIAQDALDSIPAGSVYFGGTDPGRFVVTALQKSHVDADPFFTLTQNALADGSYLDYLRRMYGHLLYIPTQEDSQLCFDEYLEDARRRLENNTLKPGENVRVVDGKPQASGQVAVMAINGLLSKILFNKNPAREFYVEESFPLDWMYPHLSPQGPIMKLNRQPLDELSDDILIRDREYWQRAIQPVLGNWLNPQTPLKTVIAYAARANPSLEDPYLHGDASRKWISKLRSSIAGLYAWRMAQASDPAMKARMAAETDFAFRQSFALCPHSPEAVFRYANFLVGQKRAVDALQVVETAVKLAPENSQFSDLEQELKRINAMGQN